MGLATTNNVRRHAKSIISHEDELLVLVESAEPLLLRHAFIFYYHPTDQPDGVMRRQKTHHLTFNPWHCERPGDRHDWWRDNHCGWARHSGNCHNPCRRKSTSDWRDPC